MVTGIPLIDDPRLSLSPSHTHTHTPTYSLLPSSLLPVDLQLQQRFKHTSPVSAVSLDSTSSRLFTGSKVTAASAFALRSCLCVSACRANIRARECLQLCRYVQSNKEGCMEILHCFDFGGNQYLCQSPEFFLLGLNTLEYSCMHQCV